MATTQVDLNRAIQQNNDLLERSVRTQDAAMAAEGYYAANAVVMPPDHPPVNGREQIKGFWQGMFKSGLRDLGLETVQVEASGDLACEIGKYTLTLSQEGGEASQAKGKYVVVLRRQQDGAWQAIVDMFSGNG